MLPRARWLAGALALFLAGALDGDAVEKALLGHAIGAPSLAQTPTQSSPQAVTPRMDKPPEARALSRAFAATAKALRPSVVRIDVERAAPRGQRSRGELPPGVPRMFERFLPFGETPDGPGPNGRGTGSGVIIDTQGHVVTNRHVVLGTSKVTVILHDGKELPARVVGKDEFTDVAVLKLETVPPGLVAARMGDSERLEVGEWVIAVGTPLGIDQTVTAGIVSGKGRPGQIGGANRVSGWIQTDAKINPGNSGGPLVNLDGEVIGVNTFINVGPGGAYGFAIPINDVRRVSASLVKEGRVRYSFLGVTVFDVSKPPPGRKGDMGSGLPAEGAFIDQVVPAGPAAQGGLRSGDVITRIDEQPITSHSDLVAYVSSRAIGSRVKVTYVRDGRQASATAVLGELPSSEAPEVSAATGKVGLSLQTLTPELARSLGLPNAARGALIADVSAGSPADRAGLRPGEVILEVDRKSVTSAEEAIAALEGRDAAFLRIRGPAGSRFVTVKRR